MVRCNLQGPQASLGARPAQPNACATAQQGARTAWQSTDTYTYTNTYTYTYTYIYNQALGGDNHEHARTSTGTRGISTRQKGGSNPAI